MTISSRRALTSPVDEEVEGSCEAASLLKRGYAEAYSAVAEEREVNHSPLLSLRSKGRYTWTIWLGVRTAQILLMDSAAYSLRASTRGTAQVMMGSRQSSIISTR